jgi:hypothetical protein
MWDSSFLQIISQVWLEPVLSLDLLKKVSTHHCECWTILISYMSQSLSSSCFQGMKVCLKTLCHVLVPKLLLLAGTYRLDRQRFPAPKWWGSEFQVSIFCFWKNGDSESGEVWRLNGQTQGKFQLIVVSHVAHAIQVWWFLRLTLWSQGNNQHYWYEKLIGSVWLSNNHIEIVAERFKLDKFVNLLLNFIAQNHDGAHAVKVQSPQLLSCDSKFLDCNFIVILILILV